MKIKIYREIDKHGRIVIPVDLRRQYGLTVGDTVWFGATDEGILIHSGRVICNNEDCDEE